MIAGNFRSYHVGLDLGRENDFSAVAILEKLTPVDRYSRPCDEPEFNVLGLKRFSLKTPYPVIVRDIARRLSQPPFSAYEDWRGNFRTSHTPIFLVFDETGVGQPVADLLREDSFLSYRTELVGVMITSGRDVTERDFGYNVPKRDLILSLQVELQKGNLKIAANLPEAANLVNELQNFEMKITKNANDVYGAKTGQHDDLVLGLGLAVWNAKNTDEDFNENEVLEKLANWTGKGY